MPHPLRARLLPALLILAAPSFAQTSEQTVLYHDFNAPSTSGWAATVGSANLSTVDDSNPQGSSAKLGDKYALAADATSTSTPPATLTVSKTLPSPVTLDPGESLTLNIRFRVVGNNTANAKGLRFGFGSAAGTYGFDLGTGGTVGGEFRRYHVGLAAAGGTPTVLATTGANQTVNVTTPHRLILTITRTDLNAVALQARLTKSDGSYHFWNATDTGASGSVLTTFDGVALSQWETAIDVYYDNIGVESDERWSLPRVGHWQFDDPAITGENRFQSWDKSARYTKLQLRNGSTPADLHSTAGDGGYGVSGASDDFALRLPNGNSHGFVEHPQADPFWQYFPKLTVCGWLKPSAVPASGKYLLDWTGAERVELKFTTATPGVLSLFVDGQEVGRTSGAIITSGDVNQWIFVAVTYTGGVTTGGVKFYKGIHSLLETDNITQPFPAATGASSTGGTLGDTGGTGTIINPAATAGDLYLGNNSDLNQVFPGLIDDFRVYDAALQLAGGSVDTVGNSLEDIRRQGFDQKNLLLNGAFDRGATSGGVHSNYWTIASQWSFNHGGGTPSHAVDSTEGYYLSPTRSQRVQTTNVSQLSDSALALTQKLVLRAGRVYKVTAWVKPAASGAEVRVMLKGDTVYGIQTQTLTDTDNFTKFEFLGGSGTDVRATLAIKLLTLSKVWVDDVSVEELEHADGATVSGPADAIPGSFFGVHLNWGEAKVWPQMGQKTVRLWDSGTRWLDLKPTETGAWNFSKLNKLLDKAEEGITPHVLYTAGVSPNWAVGVDSEGKPLNKEPPTDLADWTDYVSTVASHAVARGTPIHSWEIWNEVNLGHFYQGTIPQLIALTKETHDVLKNTPALAATQIVSPNFTTSGLAHLETYLLNDANKWNQTDTWNIPHSAVAGDPGQFIDVWAIHAYGLSGRPENHRPFFAAVKELLADRGEQTKPLWNTEGADAMPGALPSIDASGILARKYLTQWAEGISNYNWYAWDINWGGPASALGENPRHEGTLTELGKAYLELTRWLVGAKMVTKQVTRSQTGGERWVLKITRDGDYTGWIVWDTAGSYSWTPPSGPTRIRQLPPRPNQSDPLSIPYSGGAVTIGTVPVLLDSGSWRVAKIDFGPTGSTYVTTEAGWNEVHSNTTTIPLEDPNGLATDLTLSVDQPFNTASAGNTNGTTTPTVNTAPASYPVEAIRDSLFGNVGAYLGQSGVNPKITISGLDPSLRYYFSYFASRMGDTTNRTTRYKLTNGTQELNVELNPTGNQSIVKNCPELNVAGIAPSSTGTLTVELFPGTGNATAEQFTYLGALIIRATVP